MQFTEEEVQWLLTSRSNRRTRSVRVDNDLARRVPAGLSDIINLALKRYLEEKGEYGTSKKSSSGYPEEITST